jgi:hypothetical protein
MSLPKARDILERRFSLDAFTDVVGAAHIAGICVCMRFSTCFSSMKYIQHRSDTKVQDRAASEEKLHVTVNIVRDSPFYSNALLLMKLRLCSSHSPTLNLRAILLHLNTASLLCSSGAFRLSLSRRVLWHVKAVATTLMCDAVR